MRTSRFGEEQIAGILKEHAAGERVGSLCRRHGIGEQTLDRRKAKDDGVEGNELKRPKALEEENARLKRLVAGPRGYPGPRQPGAERAPPKKLAKPAQRRAAVAYAQERFGLPQRRACRLVGAGRPTARYRRRRPRGDDALRARLRELAARRPRFGYRRLPVLLRREGPAVNHERIERPYREEGWAVRRRTRKSPTPIRRGRPAPPRRANERWASDFLQDALASGRKIRVLGVIDVFTREALALEVDTSLPGRRAVRVLDRRLDERGRPVQPVLGNGPEPISRAPEEWAHQHAVAVHVIDPGKPIQNAHGERFHGRLRDECLNEHRFLGARGARRTVETRRQDDDRQRPPSALGDQTPVEFARATITAAAALPDDGLS